MDEFHSDDLKIMDEEQQDKDYEYDTTYFEFQPGKPQFVAVAGVVGSGKSTLLSCIMSKILKNNKQVSMSQFTFRLNQTQRLRTSNRNLSSYQALLKTTFCSASSSMKPKWTKSSTPAASSTTSKSSTKDSTPRSENEASTQVEARKPASVWPELVTPTPRWCCLTTLWVQSTPTLLAKSSRSASKATWSTRTLCWWRTRSSISRKCRTSLLSISSKSKWRETSANSKRRDSTLKAFFTATKTKTRRRTKYSMKKTISKLRTMLKKIKCLIQRI